MPPRPSQLILDTNVIISLHALSLWEPLLNGYSVLIPGTVEDESQSYRVNGTKYHLPIELARYTATGRLSIFEPTDKEVMAMRRAIWPQYLYQFKPGDGEEGVLARFHSLADKAGVGVCSGDGVVPRIMGYLSYGESCHSLEWLLNRIGRSGDKVDDKHKERFKDNCVAEGWECRLRYPPK